METTARKLGLGAFACAIALLVAACLAAGTAHAATYTLTKSPANKYAQAEQVFPVSLKKGSVKLDLVAGADSAAAGLYAKSDCSDTGEASAYASGAYSKYTTYGSVAKNTTYYLKIRSYATGAKVTLTQYPTSVTLKSGKTKKVGNVGGTSDEISYLKVKASKRGYFNLDLQRADGYSGYASCSVKLLNSKKKSLTGGWRSVYDAKGARGLAVKKGTYYIAFKTGARVVSAKATFKAVKTKVKTKKSKAKKLKKGKTVKAVVAAGEKAAWYKFKNTKKHKVKIYLKSKTFAGGNYGGIKVTVYEGSRSMGSCSLNGTFPNNTLKSLSKLSKGTYRIKVEGYETGCGYYTLKWK